MNPTQPLDITQTPEFKSAVAEAARLAVLEAMKAMQPAGAPANGDQGATALLSQLAMTLSDISNQGNHKIIVSPAVMKERAEAHERMWQLLLDAKTRGLKAEYRVKDTLYLGDRTIPPFKTGFNNRPVPQKISWSGPPSLKMEPLNDIAKQIYAEFEASIGNQEKLAGIDERSISVTHNGLIVHGIVIDKRRVSDPDMTDADNYSYQEDVEILGNADPRNQKRRVLGTIADPALSTSMSEAKRM